MTEAAEAPGRAPDGPARFARHLAVAALASGIWCAVFLFRLVRVPERYWVARDDGVITLSHAKNLADHGSIGVSPGGDRVEGYSSPLHLAAGTVVEYLGDPAYRTTTLLLFGLGLAVAGLAIGHGMLRRWETLLAGHRATAATMVTVAVVAVVASAMWTTTGWLASGMENPLVLAAGGMVAGATLGGLDSRSARVVAAAGVTASMIGRVEFAALCAPLLAALLVSVVDADADDTDPRWSIRRLRRVAPVIVVPVVIVAVVHLARRWYFGAWLPNTAVVQGRDAGSAQLVVIEAVAALFVLLLARREVGRSGADRDGVLARGLDVAAGVAAIGVVWVDATGRTAVGSSTVVLIPGVLGFGAVTALALTVRRWASRSPASSVHWVFAALVAVPLTQYVATGAARLDDNRVSGLAVPFLVVWAAVALIDAGAAVTSTTWAPLRRTRVVRAVAGCAAAGVALVAVASARSDTARVLDYQIAWADGLAATVGDVRDDRFDGRALVITANPDLGKLSFAKQSVMVDLGWLGDPLFATIRATRPDLMDSYLLRVAVPDVVSTHSGWSCSYRGWLEAETFVDQYEVVQGPDEGWVRDEGVCPNDGVRTTWVRGVDDGEFELTRRLLDDEAPAVVVAEALDRCIGGPGDALRCQGVRRAAQRVAHELRSDGTFDDVVAAFAESPTAAFDRAILERGPGWWDPAAAEIIRHLDEAIG